MTTILRDLAALAPSYVVPGLASLISVPILFGALGADGYGLWALMYGISNGVPQLSTSWLEGLILRFGHRPEQRSRAPLLAVAALASAVGGAVLAWAFIPGAAVRVAAVTAIATLATAGYVLAVAQLQAELRFGAVSRIASVRSIAGALLGAVGAVATRDPAIAILGLAAGFAIGATDGYLLIRREPVQPTPLASPSDALPADGEPIMQELRYGIASGIFAVAQFVLAVGDRFILSAIRPLEEVGVYAATYAIVDLTFRVAPSVIVTPLRQRLFRAWDSGNRARAADLFARGFAAIAWSMGALVVALTIGGPALRFLPIDGTLVGPLAAGLGAFVTANVLVIVYSAQIRQGRAASHVVLAAIVNVALNLLLAPGLGALGAAFATVLSYAVYLAANVTGLRAFLAAGTSRTGLALALAALAAGVAATAVPVLGPGPVYLAGVAMVLTIPLLGSIARELVRQPQP